MDAYAQELFGPVAMLFKVDSLDAAIALANDSEFGLGSAIFTQDEAEMEQACDQLEAGGTFVNTMTASDPRLPFGGVGNSGMGRIGGYEGFRSMSNERSVVHQPLDKFRDFLIQLPPYSERYSGLIMKAIKK